jgi:CPA2 family monovalent cation:H+ antiporter-2
MESRFVKNFNARQIVQQRNLNTNNDNKQFNELDNLHWIDRNMYVATLTIKEDSEINNKTLKDMNFRKSYNVIILAIKRDGIQYNFPDGDFILKDNDILLTISSITMLRKMDLDYESLTMDFNEVKTLNEFNIEQQKNKKSQINCLTFIIEKGSFWIGNSLIDSSLMKEAKCMVIGIERDDTPIVNPSSHVVFQENDMVWAMGDKKTLYKLLEKNYFDKI